MDYAQKRTDLNMPIPPDTDEKVYKAADVVAQQAGFRVIDMPDACYLNNTRKIDDYSGLPDFSPVTSVTDGTETVSFSITLEKGQVPVTWFDWGLPPYTESATPALLESLFSDSMTLILSQPAHVFGFELEPNAYASSTYTADFYNGTTLLGSITRSFEGLNSARLMAAYSSVPFDRVELYGTPSSGFAIAQIRYALESPYCMDTNVERIIPFTTTINSLFDVISIGAPEFSGYNVDVTCTLGSCVMPVDIPLPDNTTMSCCISVDTTNYNGTAKLLLTIPATFNIAFPGPYNIVLYGASDININQTCFHCPGTGDCMADLSRALVLDTIQAIQNSPTEIVISGNVRFVCP